MSLCDKDFVSHGNSQAGGKESFSQQLKQVLNSSLNGSCPIMVEYRRSDAQAQIKLGQQWLVQPSDELIQRLKDRFGNNNVRLNFGD